MEGGSVVIVNRRDNFRGNYLGRKRGTVNYYDGGGGSVSRERVTPAHQEGFRERNEETRGGRKKKGRKQGNKVKRHERETPAETGRCAPGWCTRKEEDGTERKSCEYVT